MAFSFPFVFGHQSTPKPCLSIRIPVRGGDIKDGSVKFSRLKTSSHACSVYVGNLVLTMTK